MSAAAAIRKRLEYTARMPSNSPRRWLRFRLRTLLIAVAVVAVPLAWIAKERRQSRYEMQNVEQLRKQGFQVLKIGGQYDLWELDANGRPLSWWRNLTRRVLGERVLDVLHNQLDPEVYDFTPLARFTSLEFLYLDGSKVHDLTPLMGLKRLRYVSLTNVPVSKEQIEALQLAVPNCKIDHDPFP